MNLPGPDPITLFLCGDVMLGRGIDQVLPHPGKPELHESYVKNALEYVRLAEDVNGPIPRPVDFAWIWGDALPVLAGRRPDLRVVNLETSVTLFDTPEPKGIHYRMHPGNIGALAEARVDCCVLANNHVLDWGREGLAETLATLHGAGFRTAGAGRDLAEAQAPALFDLGNRGRVRVYAFALESSGVPGHWAAAAHQPGVSRLPDLSQRAVQAVTALIGKARQPDDITVVSLHWGGNWGYAIPDAHRRFAHALIDGAEVDLIHGHSSHHPLGIEVYRQKLVLYGCGDFINDYEGIAGYEEFRGDLPLMYFAGIEPGARRLLSLCMVPLQIRQFQLHRAVPADAEWIAGVLDREGETLGTGVRRTGDGALELTW
ncbi:MAG: CapA family protein [Gammaproteobacteria bacterium]|nr:CapA family protein [Gammaproteobacteria bacterium]